MEAKNLALDGGCNNCIKITVYQLDILMVDEYGHDVWRRTLARRYRQEMEQYINGGQP